MAEVQLGDSPKVARWFQDDDPRFMLSLLHNETSPRKLRLFGVACCRSVWRRIKPKHIKEYVLVAEAFADGDVDEDTLAAAETRAYRSWDSETWEGENDAVEITHDCWSVCGPDAMNGARNIAAYHHPTPWKTQAAIIRDIFGDPFNPIAARHPSGLIVANYTPESGEVKTVLTTEMLGWNDGIVQKMALQMYQSRRFRGMTILADALEEAGCTSEEVLNHCRNEKRHFRGCFVLDLLLGKS